MRTRRYERNGISNKYNAHSYYYYYYYHYDYYYYYY